MPCIETPRSSLTRRSSDLSDSSLKTLREGTHMLMCPSQLVPGTALVGSWRRRHCNVTALLLGWWLWQQRVYQQLKSWCACWSWCLLVMSPAAPNSPNSPPPNSGTVSPASLVLKLPCFVSSQGFPFFPGANVVPELPLQVPLRHLTLISAQSRGGGVYSVEHMKRLFPALILSADGEHSAIAMTFARTGNTTSSGFLVLFVFFRGEWGCCFCVFLICLVGNRCPYCKKGRLGLPMFQRGV